MNGPRVKLLDILTHGAKWRTCTFTLATVPMGCTPQDYNVKVDLLMQWLKLKRVTCVMARQQNI